MNPGKHQFSDKVYSLWLNVHLATMTETGPYGTTFLLELPMFVPSEEEQPLGVR